MGAQVELPPGYHLNWKIASMVGLSWISPFPCTLAVSREGIIIYTCNCIFWRVIKRWRRSHGAPCTMLYIIVISRKQCRTNANQSVSPCANAYYLMAEVVWEEKYWNACKWEPSYYACHCAFQEGGDQHGYNFPLYNKIASVTDTSNR